MVKFILTLAVMVVITLTPVVMFVMPLTLAVKIVPYQNKQFFMCQQHFKLESIRVPHKVVYVTGGDGID